MKIIEDTRQQSGKHEIKHKCFDEMNVELIRCKLPFGDYAPVPPLSIDTKASIDEIANNICGTREEHKRFIRECKAAKEAGCDLYILVENDLGIEKLQDVHRWENPRSVYSPNCVQGARLQKAMETIQERYGVFFLFCSPEEAAGRIRELILSYG